MIAKTEQKEVNSYADLERIRMAHAPVLGKDPWYVCVGYSIVALITKDLLTQGGMWVVVATWMGYHFAKIAFTLPNGPGENIKWLLYGFGAHCILAWMHLCAKSETRNLLSAFADWWRNRGSNPPAQRS